MSSEEQVAIQNVSNNNNSNNNNNKDNNKNENNFNANADENDNVNTNTVAGRKMEASAASMAARERLLKPVLCAALKDAAGYGRGGGGFWPNEKLKI